MLLFIRALTQILLRGQHVSIHHMLLFIEFNCRKYADIDEFQYITCYSLSWSDFDDAQVVDKFQYITCYSLSVKVIAGIILIFSFNTSHVTLYPILSESQLANKPVSIHHMLLFIDRRSCPSFFLPQFQYITCYSLSSVTGQPYRTYTRFNTSHVTLYLPKQTTKYIAIFRFNTSHVTLYRVG